MNLFISTSRVRTILKAVGASIALPLLDAMSPAMMAPRRPPPAPAAEAGSRSSAFRTARS